MYRRYKDSLWNVDILPSTDKNIGLHCADARHRTVINWVKASWLSALFVNVNSCNNSAAGLFNVKTSEIASSRMHRLQITEDTLSSECLY